MRPNVILNSEDSNLSHGYHVLKNLLIKSNIFDVYFEPLELAPKKYWRKEEGLSVAIIDGVKILIDANGGCLNLKAIYDDGLFNNLFKDVKVIVKTQYSPHCFYDKLKNKGLKVVPWVMWPTRNSPLEAFKWQYDLELFTFTASCSGGPHSNKRWGRPPFIEWCNEQNDFDCKRRPVNDWVKTMQHCKWGLILQGGNKGNCDGKNTREVEFASFGMPMVLNYIPHYDYLFEPNKQFLFVEKPKDLLKLRTVDPRPYASESIKLWDNYLKPTAAANYLLDLVNE